MRQYKEPKDFQGHDGNVTQRAKLYMQNLQVFNSKPQAQPGLFHWYALHTRARHEKRVAIELQQNGVTTFLPLITEVRNWSDRRMKVELPLFSCYVFVNILSNFDARVGVLRTPGVLGFVGGNNLQGTVEQNEIEQIQTLLARKVPFAAHPFLEIGQRVRVRGGALDGIEGVLTRFGGSDRLVISVQTIQRSLSITVEGYEVEPVKTNKAIPFV